MIFNEHSRLRNQHAFLSASQYHWLNYDDDKLMQVFSNAMAKVRGTKLHDFAKQAIDLGIRLPKSKRTLNMYVNDAIGYRMTPEQILYYSDNCFGTADAISFRNGLLRIHDLKTGTTPASVAQLEIYAALFCLEYNCKPSDIDMELRIYQSDDVTVFEPEADDIQSIMDKIIYFDRLINEIKMEE